MIFLTVGTQFPFDRLVEAIDQAIAQNLFDEEIFAQIGDSFYRPRHFRAVRFLEKRYFDQCVKEATSIISHGGMGTVSRAMEDGKPILIMPRQRRYGEVVNDHQVAIARKLEQLGYVLVAYEKEDLPHKIRDLSSFVPRKRESQATMVAERISRFLRELCEKG
jgi:UDP-N-acetylglucosamine transferase subunit ALG13